MNDPSGECPPWLCGGIIGGLVDYGTQVTVNLVQGKGVLNSLVDVDVKSIAVSAVAGAASGGLSTIKQIKNASKIVKATVAAVTDAGTSVSKQLATKGEVSLEEIAIDVGVGQAVGATVTKTVDKLAKSSQKVKDLTKDASRAQRIANKTKRSPARQAARQRNADIAKNRLDSFGTGRAAAAGAVSSSGVSETIKKARERGSGGYQIEHGVRLNAPKGLLGAHFEKKDK